jgi:undecaprenyl-diphosphatase
VDVLPFLAVISLLAFAVAAVTERAAGPNTLAVDVTFGRWLQGEPIPFGAAIAAFGNAIGSSVVGVPLTIGAIVVMAIARRWPDTLFLFGLLLARGLNAPLKEWASSPRPPATLLRVTEFAHGLGFPSGHSMGVVLLAGGFAYVAFSALPPGRLRAIPCVVAPLVILATGYGRVHAGAHWPTDVLGGFLWGSILLLCAILARRLIITRRNPGIAL